jgi:N6-adenosine-specific RNA methylase IME4
VQGNAEICLLATKGHPHRVSKSVKQVVLAPRGRHSQKPEEVRDRIVELMGDIPRIELFARSGAEGWDCWGNEAPENNKEPNETEELS